jgi:protein-L-isoaspartate(D-aspartate) O-methyltransferase
MDIDEDLVLSARDHLANAGYGHVTTVHADGALGFAPAAPYDRIVLTVASSDIAPAWREQLAQPYGRLVLPLALRGLQRCALFQTDPADSACLVSRSPRSCSFVALRGAMGATGVRGPIEQGATMAVCASEEALAVSVETLGRLIAQPLRELPSGVAATPEEIRSGLHLWLLAREPRLRSVWATAGLPDLFGLGKRAGARGTLCIVDATDPSVALLTWAQERETGGELSVLATPGAERLSERLRQLLVEWSAAGGPGDADLSIRAYPSEHGVARVSGEVVLEQPWTHFVLNWAKPQPPAILTV